MSPQVPPQLTWGSRCCGSLLCRKQVQVEHLLDAVERNVPSDAGACLCVTWSDLCERYVPRPVGALLYRSFSRQPNLQLCPIAIRRVSPTPACLATVITGPRRCLECASIHFHGGPATRDPAHLQGTCGLGRAVGDAASPLAWWSCSSPQHMPPVCWASTHAAIGAACSTLRGSLVR